MRRGDLIATYNTFDNEKRPLLSLPQSGNGGLTPSPAAGAAGTRTSSNPPPTKRQRRFSEISQQRSPPPPPPPYYEDRPFVSLESDKPRNWKRAILTTLTFASGIAATFAYSSLTAVTFIHTDATRAPSRAISHLGRTVSLDGSYYYVPGKPKATFPVKSAPVAWAESSLFPLTVISSSEHQFGEASIDKVTAKYAAEDDVWQPAFMENVLLHYDGEAFDASLDASISYSNSSIIASGYKTRKAKKAINLYSATQLPAGPYFATLKGNQVSVFEAWKLYNDDQRSFFYGVVPHSEDAASFQVLSATLPDSNGVAAVGVPSRLYYTKTVDKPLAGVRVSVKDSYDLKGIKTSNGNRAWLGLYPPAAETAPSIQRLVDLGAIIVGKTRLSTFVNGQWGTADNVDYGTPFNARGEGYQDPSSSSSGAGSAQGSYPFIDMSVGSDTGGSVRAPAGLNGAFGNRPSQGAMDLSGITPVSHTLDTAAFLTSDAHKFAEYGKLWYGGNDTFRSYPSFPKQLLYMVNPDPSVNTHSPGFFPVNNPAAVDIFEEFVQALEGFLQVRRTEVDFYAHFKQKFGVYPPEYVGPAWSLLTAYDQWHLLGKHFYQDYADANNGDLPFVDPTVHSNWKYGAEVSSAEREFWLERKSEFQQFVASEFMERNSTMACSNTLTVFPLSTGLPFYKSDYHMETPIFKGWNRYSISQLGQVPEVVIPISQVPYLSKISKTTKYLPVSISIQAAAGCDFVLYDLVAALADAGIINNPTQGQSDTFSAQTISE